MRILAIGAHFDDLELGCGGSLLRWRDEGHDIKGLILTDSGYQNESGVEIRSSEAARNEGRLASSKAGYELIEGPFKTFGVKAGNELTSYLLSVFDKVKPELVLSHWTHDIHIDHQAIAAATLHCSRRIPRYLMYRSNWYISSAPFQGQFFVDISAYLNKKLELIKIYESEVARSAGKWLSWTESVAKANGLIAGCEFAEAFEVVKWSW